MMKHYSSSGEEDANNDFFGFQTEHMQLNRTVIDDVQEKKH
jgi:hypothetical protein